MLSNWSLKLKNKYYYIRASSGQVKNQSMVVQFTTPGKLLIVFLKLFPIGLIQMIRCKFSLHF
jgi:hypothetical protein